VAEKVSRRVPNYRTKWDDYMPYRSPEDCCRNSVKSLLAFLVNTILPLGSMFSTTKLQIHDQRQTMVLNVLVIPGWVH